MTQFDGQDWLLLEAGASELQDYLLSDELYWPVHAIPHAADTLDFRLTNGSLLLSIARLGTLALSAENQHRYDSFMAACNRTRAEWRASWEKKSQREFQTRLLAWQNYLHELLTTLGGHSSDSDEALQWQQQYDQQVRLRVILQLLLEDTPHLVGKDVLFNDLDGRMQSVTVRKQFVWDAVYSKRFSEQTYWFLYSALN